MIYICKTDSTPEFIKIGYSKTSPFKRIKSLQTGCPHKIELLSLWKGGFIIEGILHGHLKDFRVSGEWFIYSDECKAKIEDTMQKFNFKKHRVYRSDPKPRKKKALNNNPLTSKIMDLVNTGKTIRATAEILGIHKCTVLRHKLIYSKRP